MLTKEQRQLIAAHIADTTSRTPWGAAIRACLADADRYAASARERRVGEAVLGELEIQRARYGAVDFDEFSFEEHGFARAIAAALRKESDQ